MLHVHASKPERKKCSDRACAVPAVHASAIHTLKAPCVPKHSAPIFEVPICESHARTHARTHARRERGARREEREERRVKREERREKREERIEKREERREKREERREER